MIEKIYNWTTLIRAWDKVEDNDGCAGVDGVTLELFERDLDENLLSLQKSLINRTYKPAPLLRFYVAKPSGDFRALNVPIVRDRVAQTATSLVLTPIFEKEFENASFGYRLGKSRHNAIYEIQRWRDEGYIWVVDADIDSYFDEVDHSLLRMRLEEVVKNDYVIELIMGWLTAEIHDGAKITKPEKGLPQGAVISPMLANLYLDKFDEALLEHGYKLI